MKKIEMKSSTKDIITGSVKVFGGAALCGLGSAGIKSFTPIGIIGGVVFTATGMYLTADGNKQLLEGIDDKLKGREKVGWCYATD